MYMYVLHFSDDKVTIVSTPAFPESVSEGDVRWEKGKNFCYCLPFRFVPLGCGCNWLLND